MEQLSLYLWVFPDYYRISDTLRVYRNIWSTRTRLASVNNIANWLSFFANPLYRAFTKPNCCLMIRNGCSTLDRMLRADASVFILWTTPYIRTNIVHSDSRACACWPCLDYVICFASACSVSTAWWPLSFPQRSPLWPEVDPLRTQYLTSSAADGE